MTTDQKGAIAESAVAHEAIKLGLGVFKPLSDGERYDLIFDLRPQLVRVQCKWAVRRGDVVVITCRSCRRTGEGFLRRTYTSEEIDAFAAYCADTGRCYFLPMEKFEGRTAVQLRLAPSRNNQKMGVNWAEDYEFAAKLCATLGP
jgi:hypothetical protein